MAHRLYIPRQVLDAISTHISDAVERATNGFWSANEDEDTLTGHLGACLKTGLHTVNVADDEIRGPWKWSIDYAKFRGRGKNATESYLGADGIVELSLDMGYRKDTKSLLFQAKTEWQNSTDLVEQAMVMSTWREAAIVINYTPSSFEAYSIDSILACQGNRATVKNEIALQDALSTYFLGCKIGNTDLRYDARQRRLYWRDSNGLLVAVQFSVPQRVRFNVEAPVAEQHACADKELSPAEIQNHRMEANSEELLRPMLSKGEVSAKEMKQSLAMTYHPDRYSAFGQMFRDLANRRMQEVNLAYNEVKNFKK